MALLRRRGTEQPWLLVRLQRAFALLGTSGITMDFGQLQLDEVHFLSETEAAL